MGWARSWFLVVGRCESELACVECSTNSRYNFQVRIVSWCEDETQLRLKNFDLKIMGPDLLIGSGLNPIYYI